MSATTADTATVAGPTPEEGPAAQLARASYRFYRVRVARTERTAPDYVRVTLTDPGLRDFGAGGYDQRVKVVLPRRPLDELGVADGFGVDAEGHEVDWYSWWRALPDELRPPLRTYTVRAFRPATAGTGAELDLDFVLHGVRDGHAGPASSWAAAARPGDEIAVVAPSAPGTGRMWGVEWAPPADARTLLLAGDETAVPAVLRTLEQLPPGVRATAVLEVPVAGDAQPVVSAADVRVEWLAREGRPHGALLVDRVQVVATELLHEVRSADLGEAAGEELDDVDVDDGILWEVPESAVATGPDCLYAWLAGEAGVVKELRRHLVREVGVPRRSVAFMGYWRAGRAEHD